MAEQRVAPLQIDDRILKIADVDEEQRAVKAKGAELLPKRLSLMAHVVAKGIVAVQAQHDDARPHQPVEHHGERQQHAGQDAVLDVGGK